MRYFSMHKPILLFVILCCFSAALCAQQPTINEHGLNMPGGYVTGIEVQGGDTIIVATIVPVVVYEKAKDMRQYAKLVYNVKKVYPYALEAKQYMQILEAELMKLETKKEREAFTKKMEDELVEKYTPILKKMTFSQGKVLIKLIDRETSMTAYEIVREFRGKFAAGFWNTIARLFSANLKAEYDAEGEDQIIEEIIVLYEAGLL